MRLHRNLVFTVIDSLMAIFNEGAYADKMVAQALKKDKRWGSHDRKFVAETIYEIVRWKRLYTEIAEVKDPFTRDDVWRIFAVWAVLRGIKLPDWKYFESTPTRKIKGRFDELTKIRKFKEAIPDWMDELGLKELGKEVWEKELSAQNEQAKVILRVNTLKTTKEKVRAILMDNNIETELIKDQPDALVLKERANVFMIPAFKEGFYEVQDASSQLVAYFLDVKPGMRVVDTCAGAGGKKSRLFVSDDFGNSWQVYETPIIQGEAMTGIFSADFYNDKIGFITGGNYEKPNDNSNNKAITFDGGKTWKLVANGSGFGYGSCVQFVPNSNGKALVSIGANGIQYSNDFGNSWKQLNEDKDLYTIRFLDHETAFAAGRNKIIKLFFSE